MDKGTSNFCKSRGKRHKNQKTNGQELNGTWSGKVGGRDDSAPSEKRTQTKT